MQVRKQQLELDMEQQTGSKQEKEYVKAVYCHPAYLTYTQFRTTNFTRKNYLTQGNADGEMQVLIRNSLQPNLPRGMCTKLVRSQGLQGHQQPCQEGAAQTLSQFRGEAQH